MRLAIYVLLNVVCNSFASVLIKLSIARSSTQAQASLFAKLVHMVFSITFLTGVALFGFSLLAYSLVLQKLKLSIAYPLTVSLSVLIVTWSSRFVLRESILTHQIAGVVVIIFGIWMVVK